VGVAARDGLLVATTPQDMPGRFLRQGSLTGYILEESALKVRAAVPQDHIDLVRNRLRAVEVRLAEQVMTVSQARILRELPGGINELPSPALGIQGGGMIATSPADSKGVQTLERVFLVDVQPDIRLPAAVGERVYLRFKHGYEPLGFQLGRALRRIFLSHFHV